MKFEVNTMIKLTRNDMDALIHTNEMFEDFVGMCMCHTLTDDGEIVCADNGEVFATESELLKVKDILGRIGRIFNEAPYSNNDAYYTELAVFFDR